MKYEIREQPDRAHRLYRYGQLAIPRAGRATNCELEFWFEIERLRSVCEARTLALQHACGLAHNLTRPSLETLNQWRVTLDWEKLPDDFSYSSE